MHRFDDAAYVMGALDPAATAAFELHLAECAACRDRVAQAGQTVALLAEVRVDDLQGHEPDAEVPDTLLPGLLRKAQRQHRRRNWFTAAVGSAAAACLIALAVVLWPSTHATSPARQTLQAVRPSPVHATAVLIAKSWGTEIDLHCHYDYRVNNAVPYRLRVVDRNNHHYDAGSWRVLPGHETSFTGGTQVRRDRIARIQVTLPDGTAILQLTM